MKKTVNAVEVAAIKKPLKSSVKPEKSRNKGNISSVEKKIPITPSKPKGVVRNKSSTQKNGIAASPANSIHRSALILLAAVGDAFLQVEDSRVESIIKQREKIKAAQKLSLQRKWGVQPEDSHKAVESGWLALRKVFLNTLCGGEFGGGNASREKWLINFFKHDPIQLMYNYLNEPILKKRATSRGKDFFTYAGQIADTKRGRDNLFTILKGLKPMANWYILVNWSGFSNSTLPPVCLWTESSIYNVLGHEEEPMNLGTIRQYKRRLQLFGPNPRYRFVYTGKGKGHFEIFRN